MSQVTFALTKGRILKETFPLLAKAGIEPLEDIATSRKLIFDTTHPNVRLLIIRGSDVPTYVETGTADLGVVGKDVLVEYQPKGVYEPVDLGIASCKMMTAGLAEELPIEGRLRVATKFVNIAKAFYESRGQQVDLVKLSGALELAPILGIAHRIVDIVDTGKTLKANGLVPMEEIMDISSRIIVNQASMKMKAAIIDPILEDLSAAAQSAQR